MSSGAAALQALAEHTGRQMDEGFGPLGALGRTMTYWWAPKLTDPSGAVMSSTYVSMLARSWRSPFGGIGATTQRIDAIPYQHLTTLGGGIKGTLKTKGAGLYNIRGQANYDVSAGEFTTMRMSASFRVQGVNDRTPLIEVQRLTFELTKDGTRKLSATGIKMQLYEYDLPKADAVLLLKASPAGIEGGITLYEFDMEAISFDKVGAVFGVGANVMYFGATAADAEMFGLPGTVGGSFLAGTIDPSGSTGTVLETAGFGDLLEALGSTGDSDGFTGAYGRVYGDFPVYSTGGCLIKINVGGEAAAWVFVSNSLNDVSFGGRVRGFVHGKYMCLLSARGDMTLQLSKKAGQSDFSMLGQFWLAGGFGFCDPEDWTTWDDRWWDDSWCYTCGANVEMDYNMTTEGEWHTDKDADCE
jgi:hypothetical protein